LRGELAGARQAAQRISAPGRGKEGAVGRDGQCCQFDSGILANEPVVGIVGVAGLQNLATCEDIAADAISSQVVGVLGVSKPTDKTKILVFKLHFTNGLWDITCAVTKLKSDMSSIHGRISYVSWRDAFPISIRRLDLLL